MCYITVKTGGESSEPAEKSAIANNTVDKVHAMAAVNTVATSTWQKLDLKF